ncbi:hypothetical protein CEXT_666611 [Caerostris extrusa]|uniref:Uncharacterized protein n=1 Tax=Caerostris extrusa TaxID=172846 RepID=A0AAV4YBX7_CAEEX|nr:hypothetical protein CEXT_666611 [Caerostris extrusa]
MSLNPMEVDSDCEDYSISCNDDDADVDGTVPRLQRLSLTDDEDSKGETEEAVNMDLLEPSNEVPNVLLEGESISMDNLDESTITDLCSGNFEDNPMNNDIITEQTLSMKEQLPESQGMLEATTESTSSYFQHLVTEQTESESVHFEQAGTSETFSSETKSQTLTRPSLTIYDPETGEWVKYVEKPQAIDIDDSVDQGDLQTVGDSSLKKDSGSSGYPSSGSESCVPNEITIDSTAEPSKKSKLPSKNSDSDADSSSLKIRRRRRRRLSEVYAREESGSDGSKKYSISDGDDPKSDVGDNISTIENAVQQMLRVKKQALRRSPRTSPQHLAKIQPGFKEASGSPAKRSIDKTGDQEEKIKKQALRRSPETSPQHLAKIQPMFKEPSSSPAKRNIDRTEDQEETRAKLHKRSNSEVVCEVKKEVSVPKRSRSLSSNLRRSCPTTATVSPLTKEIHGTSKKMKSSSRKRSK